MKALEEIKKILEEHRPILEGKYKVKEIGIFGSYVRGDQKKRSDLDVLVEFNEPVSLLELVGLENFISDILGVKADVVPKRDIRAELKDIILKEAIYL